MGNLRRRHEVQVWFLHVTTHGERAGKIHRTGIGARRSSRDGAGIDGLTAAAASQPIRPAMNRSSNVGIEGLPAVEAPARIARSAAAQLVLLERADRRHPDYLTGFVT